MDKITQFFDSTISIIPNRFERDQVMRVVSITAATLVLFSSYKVISSSNKKKQKQISGAKEIPSPSGAYPYFGHIFSFGSSPGKQIQKWHKEVGPIYKLRMGIQNWVMIDDPELAHKIFVTNGAISSHRPESWFCQGYYSKDGKGVIFAQPGKDWQKARSAVLSLIAPRKVDTDFVDIMNFETSLLAKRLIEGTANSKDGVDAYKHLHLSSMNVVFSTSYGKRYETVDDPEFEELSSVVSEQITLGSLENDIANFIPITGFLDYFTGRRKYMKEFIDTRRDPAHIALIKWALEQKEDNLIKSLEEFDLSQDEKIVFMSDLIAGGTDTVSNTLYWIFALLCNYPDVQQRATSEIDEFIKANGRIPKFTERDQFPYLISLIKECMRIRPTTPFGAPHLAEKDIEVDGYIIPKGYSIISSMESMHANGNVYPEPEKFIPERFAHNLKTMLAAANGKFEYRDHYNFGWGRRTCPAIYFAEAELFLSLNQVLARCRIEPVKNSEGKPQMPDIETTITAGLVLLPLSYKANYIARPDAFI